MWGELSLPCCSKLTSSRTSFGSKNQVQNFSNKDKCKPKKSCTGFPHACEKNCLRSCFSDFAHKYLLWLTHDHSGNIYRQHRKGAKALERITLKKATTFCCFFSAKSTDSVCFRSICRAAVVCVFWWKNTSCFFFSKIAENSNSLNNEETFTTKTFLANWKHS